MLRFGFELGSNLRGHDEFGFTIWMFAVLHVVECILEHKHNVAGEHFILFILLEKRRANAGAYYNRYADWSKPISDVDAHCYPSNKV